MNHFAVIDLGTNTCNLLIANLEPDGSCRTVYDKKLPVKLGRGGINNMVLLPDAIERGMGALQQHATILKKYGDIPLRVIGTSALRGALNSDEFLRKTSDQLGWKIEIIDGETEALLIFRGVRLTLPSQIGKYLIVDIGGGSIEFILAEDDTIIWKRSVNIGVARVLEVVTISDPTTATEISAIENWFNSHLNELWEVCNKHRPETLVGCSGAFDTFMDIYEKEEPDIKIRAVSELSISNFKEIHNMLIESNHQTRSTIKGMDMMRVEMIVIASIFTNFVVEQLKIKRLIHTHNSLKEGVMDQLMAKEI
jgi:exopolyphosphatase / guanosine-5'-triphosphate,3'-diphosphate pyrophosphatase